MRLRPRLRPVLCAALFAAAAGAAADAPHSPFAMCSRLEARLAAGDGVTLPDADAELAHFAGMVDLSDGDWPDAFLARVGETVCVAVSPITGCYEFFDETGVVFWTVVPVLPTTDNWVAPFRHAEDVPSTDDALYESWRLVDVWRLSHAESAEFAELSDRARPPGAPRLESHAENAENAEFFNLDLPFVDNGGQLRFVNNPDPTNLCFAAFSFSETNLCFTVAWPTNELPPESTLDLYVSTNLSSRWSLLSSHPATNPPVSFSVERASVPGYVAPTSHVHGATCESITNVIASPLDGTTVYTNVLWSCATNRAPVEAAFFRLGTRHDTDGDGAADAFETLSLGTDPRDPDTDGDGIPDVADTAGWLANPLWATNAASANLAIALCEPLAEDARPVLFLGNLPIPLATRPGPFFFKLPPGELVPCRLAAGDGVSTTLWCGPPEGIGPDGKPIPGNLEGIPIATPLWCDNPAAIFGGNRGGGACNFAQPVMSIVPADDTGSHMSNAGWCIHGSNGVARFRMILLPEACARALEPFADGAASIDGDCLVIDLSGTTGEVRSNYGFRQRSKPRE